jgi:hypothetical protein
MREQKARQARFTVFLGCRSHPRQGKSRKALKTACQRSQHRRREKQKGDSRRNRIAGQPEEALRAVFVLEVTRVSVGQFAEDQRLAGLYANTGEVETRPGGLQ